MKITIDIKTDNAAFEDNPEELQTILRQVADDVSTEGCRDSNLYDSNGNKVGQFKVTGK